MAHLHCEQVRPYLHDYLTGLLPSFRRAWVAQHLASCAACSEALATLRQPDPATPPPWDGAPATISVQRAIPRWYPWAVGLCIAALGVGLAVRWPSGPMSRSGLAGSADHGDAQEVLSQEVQVQSDDVRWTLQSLLVTDQSASLTYKLDGPSGAYLLHGSVQAEGAGAPLAVWGERVVQRPGGLDGTANFSLDNRPIGVMVSLPPLLRSQGERAIVSLGSSKGGEHQHGLRFQVLEAGEGADGYTVRIAVEGEGEWMAAPELGAILADTGYAEGARTWDRERDGSVLRLSFPQPPPGVTPRLIHLPLAERIRGPWQAWVLIP